MIDGGLRSLFHSNLRAQFHWQAIETGAIGQGVPDSNGCGGGREFWVEYKITGTTSVPLRSDQVGWLLRRTRAGGRTFVAVRQRHSGGPRKGPPIDRLYLFSGADAKRLLLEGLTIPALGVWQGGAASWNWEQIGQALSAEK